MVKNTGVKSRKLDDLETTDSAPDQDIQLLENILAIPQQDPTKIGFVKYILLACIVFIMVANPFVTRLLELAFPPASSWLILMCIQVFIFFLIYYCMFYVTMMDSESDDQEE